MPVSVQRWVLAGLSVVLGLMGAFTPAQAATYDYRVLWDLPYTPPAWPQALAGDLYLPERAGPLPVVLLVHGGSWQKGRRADMAPIARRLAQAGYAAFTVSYRLAPGWRFPAPLQDLQQALRWLAENAETYELDPQRLAAWGFSAGAHLAAMLGTVDETDMLYLAGRPPLRAVVAGGTPADLRRYPRSPAVTALLGASLAEAPARYAQASPVVHASAGDPAFFLYHGRRDTLVEPAQAQALNDALQAAGVPVTLYWLPRSGHIGTALFPGPAVAAALDFLGQRLGEAGLRTAEAR